MFQPDFNAYLWLSYIFAVIGSISNIIAGAVGLEKPTKYGAGDILLGVSILLALVYIGVK